MANELKLLIDMLPWLVQHQGSSVTEIAEHFGIKENQVLNLLHMLVFTGAHQYGGGLVDIELDDTESIYVREAQKLDRPVRLTTLEATTIVGGLTYLQQIGTVVAADEVDRLLTKIQALLNDVPAPLDVVTAPVDSTMLEKANAAIASRTCLDIEYGSAGTHAVTRRTIEPHRVETQDDRSYIVAWCRESEAMRSFRFDRIHALQVNDDTQSGSGNSSDTLGSYAHTAVVLIEPGVMGEIEPTSIVDTASHADGRLGLTLEVGNLQWLARIIVASGGQVEAQSPPELRDLVGELIAKSLN